MIIVRKSLITGKIHRCEIPVTQDQLDEYYGGTGLIQKIMPDLSVADREFIKTGITESEWKFAFQNEE